MGRVQTCAQHAGKTSLEEKVKSLLLALPFYQPARQNERSSKMTKTSCMLAETTSINIAKTGGMTHTTSKPVILDFLEAKTPTQSQTIANATQTNKGKSLDLLMIPDVQ